MTAPFVLKAPPETAWQRRLRFVVEAIDAVNGELIRDGIEVRVAGLAGKPVVNFGGRFVWLAEPGAVPTEVSVDPKALPYLPASVAAPAPPGPPPAKQYDVVRVELAPTPAYPFETGTTGVRGTLVRAAAALPMVALPFDRIWLQWQDDNQPPPAWNDAPVPSLTDAAGDFAVIVRLGPNQVARTDAQGRMRVRVAATHGGVTMFSPEHQIRPGYVADVPSFAWDQFTNV
ncbi:hypothetical protein QTI17_31290 [Variovorax sp. J31P179]|uniref:hypothetical protein n=1 Tax=Variovorax sp. J31P179 TaxID=3053508 RepID=UPI0025756195|nr:hypothetical protein [Variovorax sp. J31P179]MDM0085080.1 hypothetical protein [Variovorax sp. J31P179]